MNIVIDLPGVASVVIAITGLVTAIGTYLNSRAIKKVHDLADGMSSTLNQKTAIVARQDGFEAGQANPEALADPGRTRPSVESHL